ncbi:hypothetical protein ACHAXR_006528 [Thalassiosira sp. AJA248-18]
MKSNANSDSIEHYERDQNKFHALSNQHRETIYPDDLMALHPSPRMEDNAPKTSSLPSSLDRRKVLQSVACLSLSQPLMHPTNARASTEQAPIPRGKVFEIEDPNTYSAVAYIPPTKKGQAQKLESFPLLVVLHGAGNDEQSALYEFTQGDHANLPPYLLSTNQAPASLRDNFVVVAPYAGKGKRSLYDEPRGKILSFIKWFNTWVETQTISEDGTNDNNISINRQRVSLFGFSEGSTLAVELATTRQFNGIVVCSYGYTGILPKLAVEKLQGIPMWVFHSQGDDIYDIRCSNQLVDSLLTYEGGLDVFDVGNIIKYTKLIPQQSNNSNSGDGKGVAGREHVRAALAASKSDEVYSWLLSLQ